MNKMNLKPKNLDLKHIRKVFICVAAGTGAGLVVYGIFLYYNIAIYGWNLGLIFAPLIAGYVETLLANRIIGENIGAISAFILFIDTTFYSFILKNPSLGFNIITAGSTIIILQAAFPTLINYILLVVVGGILASFIKSLKRGTARIKKASLNQRIIMWDGKIPEEPVEIIPYFDENKSNTTLNNLDFYFLTSSDMRDKKHDIIGINQSEVIIDKDAKLIKIEPEKIEQHHLVEIKNGKDECLIKLANQIKSQGGNGVLDLTISYGLIGMGGDNIQITAMGMGIYLY